MEILKLYDDSHENSCWFVWLLPFSEEIRGYPDIVIPYQENCIIKGIFGLGWRSDANNRSIETEWKNEKKGGYRNALGCYKKIKEGDYVVTRTKNGDVYVGRVSKTVEFFEKNEDVLDQDAQNEAAKRFRLFDTAFEYKNKSYTRREFLSFPEISYGCYVGKWYKCGINLIPSEIQGRLSQRRHPTIQPVNTIRQQILIRAMFDIVSSEDMISSMPLIERNRENYIRSLNYMELEDLVAYYIMDNNPGYMLQPSSCKINEPKYEFRFVSYGKKPITCQVKNQEEINVSDYENQDAFSKVYLFSGLWNNTEVKKLLSARGNNNIFIIDADELFNTLIKHKSFFNDIYYCYQEKNDSSSATDYKRLLEEKGYHEKEDGERWSAKDTTLFPVSKQISQIHDFENPVIEDDLSDNEVLSVAGNYSQCGDICFLGGNVIISMELNRIVVSVKATSYRDKKALHNARKRAEDLAEKLQNIISTLN